MTTGRKWMIGLEAVLLVGTVGIALLTGQLGIALPAPAFLGLLIYDLVR